MLNLIETTGFLRSWIENSTINVQRTSLLSEEAKIRLAHSSTSIEGNPLSISQVEVLSNTEKSTYSLHEIEVKNYLEALRYIERNYRLKITEKSIMNLHKLITRNLLPSDKTGKYKNKQNYIINEKGIRIYIPASPQKTPRQMNELIAWLNSSATKDLNPIIICAIFHHRFLSIHPFSDGNGRLARLIATLILYQRGFDTHHIFTLDDYFAGNRAKYYDMIQQARELDNDLTYWIEYVCQGIVNVLKDVKDRIEKLNISSISKLSLSRRQEEIIKLLRNYSTLSVSDLKKPLKLTRARINQIITPLINNGIIKKTGLSRATKYYLTNMLK